ncbi:MAG: sulfite exporter TauE/SafE family protein [Limisphaerales bacterium]
MDLLTFSFALTLAALIGLSLGLLGSGGSIITLPVLVYVAKVPAQQAVGMSLVIVGGTSALGTLLNLRQGAFDWRAAAFFSVSGMAGAFVGAKLTHLVSAPMLMFLFGALMLVVGIRLLCKGEAKAAAQECRPVRCLVVGVAVGVLTGFLGVGGGFLILPALVLLAGLEMKPAIGTSLAIIAVNCVGGLVGQLRYANFDWRLTLGFLLAAMVGMIIGAVLAKKLSAGVLRRGFAWCVVLLGFGLVARNLADLISR